MISINSNKQTPSLYDGAHNLTTESVLKSAEEAVEAARSYTNDSLDKAGTTMREVRANLSASTEQLAEKAQDLARKGIDAASRTSARTQKVVNQYATATTRYVSDQPVKSVMIAVAVGAAVAALVMLLRSRDE
jgi:ElaB/YqjD/DUF883 family membrane-anchored ribosome-binding protein